MGGCARCMKEGRAGDGGWAPNRLQRALAIRFVGTFGSSRRAAPHTVSRNEQGCSARVALAHTGIRCTRYIHTSI